VEFNGHVFMSLETKTRTGKRVALASIAVSALLAALKISVGLLGRSTSVVADGLESAGDVVASGFVFFGFHIAARPADENHPYGHGRYETLTGLVVGIILILGGIGISYRSIRTIADVHESPAAYGLVPLGLSMVSKAVLCTVKFRFGRRIGSSALIADAWNDFVDIIGYHGYDGIGVDSD
jgi:cation diffusion facilitator family transporter